MGPAVTKVVFFDLDGTLFNHHHSLRLAISAAQQKYSGLGGKKVEELVRQYDMALQQAYDGYLNKMITYEEADTRKIHLFFTTLGLLTPSPDEIRRFWLRIRQCTERTEEQPQEVLRLWLDYGIMDIELL